MNEPQSNNIDAKAHGQVLAENARLKEENADMRRRRNDVLIANDTAWRSLIGALPPSTMVITGIEQLAQRAAERIKELEKHNAQLKERLFKAEEAARNIQENSAESIKALRDAHFEAQDHIKELRAECKRLRHDNNNWQCLQVVFDITYDKNRLLRRQLAEADAAIKIVQEENERLKEQVSASIANTNEAMEQWMKATALQERAKLAAQLSIAEEALGAVRQDNARLGAQLAASEEALAQVQQESAALREERDKLQERSAILLRQLDIKRDELRRADQDHNGAYAILREAFPKQPRRVGLDTLIVLARAAVDKIAILKERSERGRLRAMQTNNRLREELKAARKVCDAVVKWAAPGSAIVEATIDLQEAVRGIREQTTNQQPQGEQIMPTVPYTELDTLLKDHMEAQSDNRTASAQGDFEDGMKRRLQELLDEAPPAPGWQPVAEQEPATEQAPSAQWPITPETAPVGARILVRDRSERHAPAYEVTIHEWAPSGKRVLVYDREGSVYWSEDLPAHGILLETLPESPQRKIVRAMVQKLRERLTSDGAEGPGPTGLHATLKDLEDWKASRKTADQVNLSQVTAEKNASDQK